EAAKLQPALRADAHFVEQRTHAPPALRRRVAEQRGEIEEQLFRGEVVIKVRAFWQVPDAPLHRNVADRPPENFGAPGGRVDQLHHQLQRRRFARAVRPQEPEYLALVDQEREMIEGPIGPWTPEAYREILGKV